MIVKRDISRLFLYGIDNGANYLSRNYSNPEERLLERRYFHRVREEHEAELQEIKEADRKRLVLKTQE